MEVLLQQQRRSSRLLLGAQGGTHGRAALDERSGARGGVDWHERCYPTFPDEET